MRPASVTNNWLVLVASLAGAALIALGIKLSWPPVVAALIAMGGYALACAILDLAILKVHKRESTGLCWPACNSPSPYRVLVKLLGLAGTIAVIAFVYWAFDPIQRSLPYALPGLALASLVVLPLTLVYFWVIDRHMAQPEDGYWHMGRLLLGRISDADWPILKAHALNWLIKAIFLPYMFNTLTGSLAYLQVASAEGYVENVRLMISAIVALELVIVCVGYSCTIRLTDSHIRSPNPLIGAWVVTLICYAPFSNVTFSILDHMAEGHRWNLWLDGVWLQLWGAFILAAYLLWMWSAAMFGLRWSNLTHRGIITNGPYKYCKHPDYAMKVCFWWLVYVPFLSADGLGEAFRSTLVMIAVSLIFWGRAHWEEKHLMADPVYQQYAAWIAEHGLVAKARRLALRPLLRAS